MAGYRKRLGGLAGLAGGSLATGVPFRGVRTALREAVESDATGFVIAVIAEFLVESPAVSTALTWLFVLGILYTYTDVVYLRQVAALTDRRGFRFLTAALAGGFALLFGSSAGGSRAMTGGIGLIGAGIVVFSLYLWYADVDPFAPDGVTVPLVARMASTTPEELLAELEASSDAYYRLSASSFYLAPAAIFTISCLVLGVVVLALVEMYPIPELTVLAVAGLSLVEATTPVDVSGRLRSGLRLESRIIDPLAAATANIEGIALTMLCAVQLLFSAFALTAGVSVVLGLATHEGWPDVFRALRSVGRADAIAIVAALAVVAALVASLLVWGAYGILFWVRELQRLPALVGNEAAETTPPVARIPGAMVPANALTLVAVAGGLLAVRPRLAAAEGPEGVPLARSAAYLVVTAALFAVCVWTVRSAWARSDPQSVDRERSVLGVAFVGTYTTLSGISASLGVISTAEAVAVPVASVVALVVLVWGPAFAFEVTEADSVGPVSGDAAFTAAVVFLCLAMAAFLDWYFPAASPWLPGSLLAFGGAVFALFALGYRQ